MAQHEELDVLGGGRSGHQQEQPEHLQEDQVEQPQRHAGIMSDRRSPLVSDPGPTSGTPHVISGRAEVHQATGMVLVQLDVTAEVALARMRAYAFVEQRLLIDIARHVVARKLRFTDDMA